MKTKLFLGFAVVLAEATFGGTTACLPAQTLSKIKYNDLAVCQDREGYILTAGRGTLILFR